MLRYIKGFISFFTTITTAILMIGGINFLIFGGETLAVTTPIQILIAGAATALPTTLAFCTDFKRRRSFVIASILHFLSLCVIMNLIGVWFGWMSLSVGNLVMMIVDVAIVYAIVFALTYLLEKKEADELNRALRERNQSEQK